MVDSDNIVDVEIRQLRYAAALAEHAHFGRAAAALGISQPSLSRQIAGLESDLGAQLFRRERGNVTPTAAGAVLIATAAEITDMLDTTRSEVERVDRGETGTVTIGFIGSAFHELLLASVPAYQRAFPNVALTLEEMSSARSTAAVAAGELDVAIGRGVAVPDSAVAVASLRPTFVVAVMSRMHPLAGQTFVRISQVAPHALVVAADADEPASMSAVRNILTENHASSRTNILTRDIRTMAALAETGCGIGLGPASLRALAGPGLWVAELAPRIPMPGLTISVRTASASTAVSAFLKTLAAAVPSEKKKIDRLLSH